MTKTLADLCANPAPLDPTETELARVRSLNTDLSFENAWLRMALTAAAVMEPFMRHDARCVSVTEKSMDCDCGYREADRIYQEKLAGVDETRRLSAQ